MLRKAIIEQYKERFEENEPKYCQGKINRVAECQSYEELIYLCMNIDMTGHKIIANKIGMSHRDFAFLLSAHRALSQGNIYEGKKGFPYKKEESTHEGKIIQTMTYPDESTAKYAYTTPAIPVVN